MLSLDNITSEQYQAAVAEQDNASYHGSISELDAAYIAEMVRQEVSISLVSKPIHRAIQQSQPLIPACRKAQSKRCRRVLWPTTSAMVTAS